MSPRSRCSLVALFALAILGVLAWLLLHRISRKGDSVVGSDNGPIDDVEVAEPTQVPSSVKNPSPRTQAASAIPARTADPFLMLDPLKAPDYQSAVFIQKIQRLQKRWESGEPDPNWTARIVTHVSDQMRQHDISGRVAEIACRTGLCRITMEFGSIEKMADLNRFEYPEGYSGYHTTHVDDGQYLGRLFVVPPGVSMASIFVSPSGGVPEQKKE